MLRMILTTMTFDPEVLDSVERDMLEQIARDIIIRGDLSHIDTARLSEGNSYGATCDVFKRWATELAFGPDNKLLVYSTVFPQRMLLTVLDYDARFAHLD